MLKKNNVCIFTCLIIVISFTTLGFFQPPPQPPVITGPPAVAASNPTITWLPAATADTYELLVYDIGLGQEVISATNLSSLSYSTNLTTAANYQVFMRSVNSAGSSSWGTPYFFDIPETGTPIPPTQLAHSPFDVNKIKISWANSSPTATYDLLIYDVDLGQEVANIPSISDRNITVESLGPGNFQAFVRAVNSFGASNYSQPYHFSLTLPILPTITNPPFNPVVNTCQPTISWTALPTALEYDLLLYDEFLGILILDQKGIQGTSIISPVLQAGQYQVFVRGLNEAGTGNWSVSYSFINVPIGVCQ